MTAWRWEGGAVRGCALHDVTFFHGDGAKNDPPGTEYPPCAMCCGHESAGEVCFKCGARRVADGDAA